MTKKSPKNLHRSIDTLWNFMSMGHKVEPSDCIFVLCSNDTRVAEYAAELYQQKVAPYIVFSEALDDLLKAVLNAQKQKLLQPLLETVACLILTSSSKSTRQIRERMSASHTSYLLS